MNASRSLRFHASCCIFRTISISLRDCVVTLDWANAGIFAIPNRTAAPTTARSKFPRTLMEPSTSDSVAHPENHLALMLFMCRRALGGCSICVSPQKQNSGQGRCLVLERNLLYAGLFFAAAFAPATSHGRFFRSATGL